MIRWQRTPTCLLLAIAAFLLCRAPSQAGEVCKRICIQGYESFCLRAHPYQQNTTLQIDHVVIYIERARDGTFNFASNVLTEGVEFPTKIVGFKELLDIDDVFFNLDQSFQDQVKADPDKVLKTFHDTVQVYVTPDVLKADASPQFDLMGVTNVHVVKASH
jgi:hypothetical protein